MSNEIAKFGMPSNIPPTAKDTMQIIYSVPYDQVPELQFVKEKYIQNHNIAHPNDDAELMYHRNVFFLKQALDEFKDKDGDPIKVANDSVYGCMLNAAAENGSFAPADEEYYLYPLGGRLFMQKRPNMYIKRLIETNQISRVLTVQLVKEGDDFEVEDDFVKRHKRNFKTDTIIAGYIKFLLPDGKSEKHIVYEPFDWDSWRASSKDMSSGNWRYTPPGSPATYKSFQPKPGFLKSKIISHACQERTFTPGRLPVSLVIYQEVIRERDDIEESAEFATKQISVGSIPEITPHEEIKEPKPTPATIPSFLKKKASAAQPATEDKPF